MQMTPIQMANEVAKWLIKKLIKRIVRRKLLQGEEVCAETSDKIQRGTALETVDKAILKKVNYIQHHNVKRNKLHEWLHN
jgi:hypothetical protein